MALARKVGSPRAAGAVAPADIAGPAFPEVSMRLTRERIPGLDESAARLGVLLTRSALAHVQASEALVHRPAGWSWSGFRIMYIIWMFGEAEARDLARISGVSRQTTSTVLATLESSRLIRRQRTSTTDRRLVSVSLTDEGTKAFEAAFVAQNELDSDMFAELSDVERQTLQDLLQRVLVRTMTRADAKATSEPGSA